MTSFLFPLSPSLALVFIVQVSSANRERFVILLVHKTLVAPVTPQANAFADGVGDILEHGMGMDHFLKPLMADDLADLVFGKEEGVEVEEWKRQTEYHGYGADDPVVGWGVAERGGGEGGEGIGERFSFASQLQPQPLPRCTVTFSHSIESLDSGTRFRELSP